MRLNNKLNNDFKVFRSGVAYTPRILVLDGIGWILLGIRRRLNGRLSNLSGKPTNQLLRALIVEALATYCT